MKLNNKEHLFIILLGVILSNSIYSQKKVDISNQCSERNQVVKEDVKSR